MNAIEYPAIKKKTSVKTRTVEIGGGHKEAAFIA